MSPIDDLNNIFNPERNGVSNFFKDDVASFFKNDFMGFIKGDILPITKSFLDITVQSFLLPQQLINNLFKSASSIASGNGIYILVFGVAGIAVLGGVMYYKK